MRARFVRGLFWVYFGGTLKSASKDGVKQDFEQTRDPKEK